MAGLRGGNTVDRGLGVAGQDGGGERVEVVFAGEEQDGGDAVQFGAGRGGRGEQFAGHKLQARLRNLLTLLI